MAVTVEPAASCSAEQLAGLFAGGGWPAFIEADREAGDAVPRVREVFGAHELALVEDGRVVTAGWGVPLGWDGTVADLPSGYSSSLRRALDDYGAAREVHTFVLCAIQVRRDASGRALAGVMVSALVDHAGQHGLSRVIAPLRPTLKHRYPLTAISDYASWTRGDGRPLDPWLRLHLRLGAQVLTTTETSQTFTGTVQQWQDWSGLALPASGAYIIPDALAPLRVDRPADLGSCTEPGIWVQHRT